jgi:hypothetical protein
MPFNQDRLRAAVACPPVSHIAYKGENARRLQNCIWSDQLASDGLEL